MFGKIEKGKFEQVATPPPDEEGQIAQKIEKMIKEDPSLKEFWDENLGEFEKAREEVRQKLREEAKSDDKE